MRIFVFTMVLVASVHIGHFTVASGGAHLNLAKDGVVLHGYDTVSYFQGKPAKGDTGHSVEYMGGRYLFSSEGNQKQFVKDPSRYTPAFGGWCAWAMLSGEKVDIDPERFKIVGGELYLYYNSFFTDTLKKWNILAGKDSEWVLVEKADANWERIIRGE